MLAPSPEDADHDLLYKGLPLYFSTSTHHQPLLRETKTWLMMLMMKMLRFYDVQLF